MTDDPVARQHIYTHGSSYGEHMDGRCGLSYACRSLPRTLAPVQPDRCFVVALVHSNGRFHTGPFHLEGGVYSRKHMLHCNFMTTNLVLLQCRDAALFFSFFSGQAPFYKGVISHCCMAVVILALLRPPDPAERF